MGKSARKPAAAPDLFEAAPAARRAPARSNGGRGDGEYTAHDIEVLEGLEPVRRRPGMYIGGTDEKALHHLFAEAIDNSMDEALAGHASFIEVELTDDGYLAVTDNGRGIPVDPHPKFPKKSALEVIMCTLHAGGKFDSKVYETSGGLHGVGISVVNALSERLEVEVARGGQLYRQSFSAASRRVGLKSLAARQTGAAPRYASSRTPRFSAPRSSSIRGASSRWRAPRRISSAASKSAGTATRNCCTASRTCRRIRPSISPRD